MFTGLGFPEILVILSLILLFFGTKELPGFIREIAKFMAKARQYSDKVKRELNDISRPIKQIQQETKTEDDPYVKKKKLRKLYETARQELSEEQRFELSERIIGHLCKNEAFARARSVMIYVAKEPEVETHELIASLLAEKQKRVVVPYCDVEMNDLGLSEIKDRDIDLKPGHYEILEPVEKLRDNFFKSDLQLIICPAVAFDREGGRLGRGKHYYDTFLSELKGRIPIIGLAYSCQIMDTLLPFEYHDVAMDQVITEHGKVLKDDTPAPGESEPPQAADNASA
ncbi:MAG: 5-formyltetrahydrofolate cyclo-ligase [Chitinivibrionales bacterium]|nr:5-formyltetrahydrofolate cyclo-ligase [Chitinivibrionales bacterium]